MRPMKLIPANRLIDLHYTAMNSGSAGTRYLNYGVVETSYMNVGAAEIYGKRSYYDNE
jgi:hypothetical protein